MDSLIDQKENKKGTNKIFIVAGILAVLAVAGIVIGVSMMPSPAEEKAAVLENAYREGSEEFDGYNKEIIITTDPRRLYESTTGLGDIVMQISGRIRNKGDKTVTGLEVSVGMVDTKNELIKDKKVLVVPQFKNELAPGETIDLMVNVPGFEEDDDRANARWKVTAIKFK